MDDQIVPKRRGPKSEYSEEKAGRICELLMHGKSLREICEGHGMPHRITVFDWLARYPEFAARYALAREFQADYMDDMILETARDCTPETANADRVRIAAYQWRAKNLRPKVYGDKSSLEADGKIVVEIRKFGATNGETDG